MVMAKAKVLNLDKAMNKLFKNYEIALTKAMTYASEIARDDIDFKAKSCLYEYYDYYEPKIYERTGRLENAFVPYMNIRRIGEGVEASVGMGYDASRLDGFYYSEASKKPEFNPVNSEWILDNYLAGIHPKTNGYPWFAEELKYIEKKDPISPDTKMEEYLNHYTKKFNENVLVSFTKQLTRR